jgi:folate-dependent phosphoribosylglycinamide formyltransferase PurN
MLIFNRPAAPLAAALLTSRRAPGLERLLARSAAPAAPWRIVAAVASEPSTPTVGALRAAGIPTLLRDPRSFHAARGAPLADRAARRDFDRGTAAALAPLGVDALVLCGWLWVLTEAMLAPWDGRAVNVHDSDLTLLGSDGKPRYRGLGSTRDAVAAGEPETRSTVHLLTPEVDTGPALVRSWGFPVHPLVEDARRAGEEDVVSAYAYAHRGWMMRAAWGPLLERALDRLAGRGEERTRPGRARAGDRPAIEELERPPERRSGPPPAIRSGGPPRLGVLAGAAR